MVMENSVPITQKQASVAPWRRQSSTEASTATTKSALSGKATEFVPSFNVKAAEFVPSFNTQAAEFVPSFNTQAAEFVPSFMTIGEMQPAAAPPVQSMNCMSICLDGYSDDSDSDSSDNEPQAKVPTPVSGDVYEPQKQVTNDSTEDSEEPVQLSRTPSSEEGLPVAAAEGSTDFTIGGLLRLRHAVSWMEGIEDGMHAKEVSPRELPSTKVAADENKVTSLRSLQTHAGEKAPASEKAVEKRCLFKKAASAEKSWRDRDSHKETRDRSHTSPADSFFATRAEAPPKLKVSDNSFAARQKMRRHTVTQEAGQEALTDEEIVRSMKSILNKLTIEKFSQLSRKLVTCGIQTTSHLETLIHEVFEKATTQHHFINMYADLCTVLHSHFSEVQVTDGNQKMNFKKVLLNACQASFERHLSPPVGLDRLDDEDRTVAEQKYKMRMLGNIRFVGALLVRKMLATKVMFAIIEELLSEPTPEALESLASLLHVVGPTFDVPDWPHRSLLNVVFDRVEALSKQKTTKSRVRCLLQDVMDIRGADWEDRKPKKLEAPTSLKEVAEKYADEAAVNSPAGGGWQSPSSWQDKEGLGKGKGKGSVSGYGYGYGSGKTSPSQWSNNKQAGGQVTRATNITSLTADLFGPAAAEKTGSPKEDSVPNTPEKTMRPSPEQPKKRKEKGSDERFDKEACRKQVTGALTELRVSHDVKEAILHVSKLAVPLSQQWEELCEVLALVSEEGSEKVRKIGFQLITGLFTEGHWKPGALGKGLTTFMEGTCADLKCDVPALPKIVREELYPAFQPLVTNGLLQSSHHELLMGEF